MSCGNGCGCCPKCGCRATCTCNHSSWFEDAADRSCFTVTGEIGGNWACGPTGTCAANDGNNYDQFFFTVAEETGKCGNCSCPPDTCVKDGTNNEYFSSDSEETGKCGNCLCPPGTCDRN
ncbi:hypothetical protein CY35_01G036200 [Sphagnum magellanicum]|nr:hypothetical protein CY35_01G036200 [Sphagnum magellanicum]